MLVSPWTNHLQDRSVCFGIDLVIVIHSVSNFRIASAPMPVRSFSPSSALVIFSIAVYAPAIGKLVSNEFTSQLTMTSSASILYIRYAPRSAPLITVLHS